MIAGQTERERERAEERAEERKREGQIIGSGVTERL